jgi:hypothetical protein
VEKGDTVTDGTFNYIVLKAAGKKTNGSAAVYGLNKTTFNDEDSDKTNDSPSKLTIPAQIKYNEGLYDVTATGSSGKATLNGTSSNYQYYWGNAKKIVLPDSITIIGDNSFANAEKLKKIKLPSGVTAIGGEAFSGTALKTMKIPSEVQYIGRAAFWKCASLKKITFEKGIETIGKWAFQQSGLKKVVLPSGLTEIKQAAFSKCLSLTSVQISETVSEIGAGVFSGCESLKKVKVKKKNQTYCSVNQVIYTKDGTVLVDGGGASGSLEIEDGTEKIEKCAFESNKKITGVTMPDSVTAIKEGAFLSCTKLKKAVVGSGLSKLGASAFAKCSLLKSIVLSDNLQKIQKSTFYRCTSLQSVTIGKQTASIGKYAFSGCQSLTSIEIPGSVSDIGTSAFYQNVSLQELTFSDGTINIGKKAFAYCNLSSVTLPETLVSLGNAAFQGNKKLSEVYIPASVTEISDNVFASCPSLSGLTVSEENETYRSEDGMLLNKKGTRLIAWPAADGDVELSEDITTIGSYAFQNTSINSLIIPSSVMKIEEGAFVNCQELLWVKFEGNEVLLPAKTKDSDGNSTALFYGCYSLQTVSAPELDETDQIQTVFAERLKAHMDSNGTIAWLNK